ncbi:MAG: cob(I)yrinic acid a,c-diamide adenosyltransferase [Acidobacteriota bacterium]|nr:cob(I)yrinic acid a,c-diamide adenosyltransferase [Blastocatellia bacterium]MDW8411896.1 cob(I)yrinic acid a,c-diamide adenosyltransferase [Acidobacteriota bacterium]
MRITRVYTKRGDKGETDLVDGSRISKASLRVDAFGDVDELNSLLGLARTKLTADKEIDEILSTIQNDLFIVGADLASPMTVKCPRVEEHFITALEKWADLHLEKVGPLKEFILPGGSEAGALLHLARAVARRAERRVVKLDAEAEINRLCIAYLNRLSDLLFVLAREVNRRTGAQEQSVDFKAKHKDLSPPREGETN